MFLQRGAKVNLRCETTAEPSPSFSWIIPRLYNNISAYGPSWVSGIKWQHTLVIKSLNCLNSGDYKCLPKNVVSERESSSVAIRVTGLFVNRIVLANQFNKTQAMSHEFYDCRQCNMPNGRFGWCTIPVSYACYQSISQSTEFYCEKRRSRK